ncbi:iron uptake porin [Anthocerotibacter panamensis]|uniref:iron uptake porin n=1 Tax=Anthocerotibacter panamensis TaxID=2857077 RepID=UPI001C40440D|nr:iron uptake porin [Anthocerotibacter panamensis]
MKIRSARWSLAVASAFLAFVGSALPALALPDTSVRGLVTDTPLVSQVSSVSELTDVDPNGFAFQALKSLVERYGCIEGYPSKVFLGNKALTRYEFAAGLNACLEKINELIAAGTTDLITKEDLATVSRLQDELKGEGTALTGRVDALEGKTKELEANLFSKTTKLDAEIIFLAAGAVAGSAVRTTNAIASAANTIDGGSQNTIAGVRSRLNFRARNIVVKGDQLRVRINAAAGDGSFFGTSGFSRVARFDALPAAGPAGSANSVLATATFDKLYYQFPFLTRDLTIVIGPRVENIDYLGTNSNTRNEAVNFSLRSFRRNVGLSLVNTSVPAIAATYKISPVFDLRAYYGATAGGDSFGFGSGGITGPGQVAVELGIKPDSRLDIGLGYYHTVCNSASALNSEAPSSQNRIFCDSSVGGSTRAPFNSANVGGVIHNTYNAHIDWDIFPEVAIFGRYSFGNATFFDNPVNNVALPGGGTVDYQEFLAGLTFKNPFGQQGNAIGLAVVQPATITSNAASAGNLATSTLTPGATSGTAEYNYGVYYRFGVAKGITITPELYFITNAGSIQNQPTITVGALRATFTY